MKRVIGWNVRAARDHLNDNLTFRYCHSGSHESVPEETGVHEWRVFGTFPNPDHDLPDRSSTVTLFVGPVDEDYAIVPVLRCGSVTEAIYALGKAGYRAEDIHLDTPIGIPGTNQIVINVNDWENGNTLLPGQTHKISRGINLVVRPVGGRLNPGRFLLLIFLSGLGGALVGGYVARAFL